MPITSDPDKVLSLTLQEGDQVICELLLSFAEDAQVPRALTLQPQPEGRVSVHVGYPGNLTKTGNPAALEALGADPKDLPQCTPLRLVKEMFTPPRGRSSIVHLSMVGQESQGISTMHLGCGGGRWLLLATLLLGAGSGAAGETDGELRELMVGCIKPGGTGWTAFETLKGNMAYDDRSLDAAAEESQDWRQRVVVDAIASCRKGSLSPKEAMAEILMLERSWREEEIPDVKISEELADALRPVGKPAFNPRAPIRHVVARRDRLRPATEDGRRAILRYVLMTLPADVPGTKPEKEALGLKMRHELICARIIAFVRLSLDPCDEMMKRLAIREIELGERYFPLLEWVEQHADDEVLAALAEVEPDSIWGETLARVEGEGARDILLRWSESEESAIRGYAYVSLVIRSQKYNEPLVVERVRAMKEKYSTNEARTKRMMESLERMERLNRRQDPAEGPAEAPAEAPEE